MVSTSMAISLVLSVVIFVALVSLFFSIFGNSECDGLANTTAIELVDAINRASLETDVEPWYGEGVPPDEMGDYYVTVPIRLCEVDSAKTSVAWFSSQLPTYILTYEIFPPEGSISWGESQPFSGGAGQAILNYATMKYGFKAASYAGGLVRKSIKSTGGLTGLIKTIGSVSLDLTPIKIRKAIDNIKNNRVIKFFLRNSVSGKKGDEVADQIDDIININYASKELKGTINDIKDKGIKDTKDITNALGKMGMYEVGPDGDILTKGGKPVLKREFNGLAENLKITLSEENAKKFSDAIVIQPRFSWLDDTVTSVKAKWVPAKTKVTTWWENSWLKTNIIDNIRSVYNRLRGGVSRVEGGFNKVFNYGDEISSKSLPAKFQNVREVAIKNKDEIRKGIIDIVKKEDETGEKLLSNLKKVTGKSFDNIDELSDADVIKYIESVVRLRNSQDLAEFVLRHQDAITGDIASRAMSKNLKDQFDNIKKLTTETEKIKAYDDIIKSFSDWDDVKGQWMDVMSSGFLDESGNTLRVSEETAKEVFEQAKLSMHLKGLFDRESLVKGNLNVNKVISQANKVKNDMITAQFTKNYGVDSISTDNIIKYLSAPVIHLADSDAFKVTSFAYQKGKKFFLLDLNKIGEAPIYSPLNIIPGAYTVEQSLKKATEIKEGGCASNSICKLQRGAADGPTETASAYLLDSKVEESIEVKLWRQNPDITERIPSGVNTILLTASPPEENPRFYVVSPCFAMAKVWKNDVDKNVYVYIDKTGVAKKCDVGECEQTVFDSSVPFLEDVPIIGNLVNKKVQLDSVDTPNFCYADEDYIWGSSNINNVPNPIAYYGAFGVCMAGCIAGSGGWGATSGCSQTCKYSTMGLLTVEVVAATQDFRDSTYKRQNEGWGYWNFQAAEDICDGIDALSSVSPWALSHFQDITKSAARMDKLKGVWKGFSDKVFKNKLTNVGSKIFDIDDWCYSMTLIGDTSLAWPVKTPAAETWRKAAILNDKCMQSAASECLWISRCLDKEDCDEGWVCDNEVCRPAPLSE